MPGWDEPDSDPMGDVRKWIQRMASDAVRQMNYQLELDLVAAIQLQDFDKLDRLFVARFVSLAKPIPPAVASYWRPNDT